MRFSPPHSTDSHFRRVPATRRPPTRSWAMLLPYRHAFGSVKVRAGADPGPDLSDVRQCTAA